MRELAWAYGVTTVPERIDDLLPRTLASLEAAGFDRPRLFVDGKTGCVASSAKEITDLYAARFPNLDLTVRYPALRTNGHWVLALYELFIREPAAHRYAMFQDDFVTYRNLRSYLDRSPYPPNAYLNLYTFTKTNEPVIAGQPPGWYEAGLLNSPAGTDWQAGRGAVALVFDRAAVMALLSSLVLVDRFTDATWAHRKIDGAIVNAMNQAGYREYVHAPSLVQHTGDFSTMGSLPQKYAQTFRGEEFDALALLASAPVAVAS